MKSDGRRCTRKLLALALAGGMAVVLPAGCGDSDSGPSAASTGTHEVTDVTGTRVAVPNAIDRIADAWYAHNEVVQMLGAGDKLVATVLDPAVAPWLYKIQPHLSKAQTVFTSDTVNTEELVQTRPDLLFSQERSKQAAKTAELRIPTVQVDFKTYDALKSMVTTTADALGSDAPAQATHYNAYLDDTLDTVKGATSKLAADERPTVLHIYSLDPLVVDGTGNIIDAWIKAAGGRNAARVSGRTRPVSIEQIQKWNPDVIILAAQAALAKTAGGQQTLDKLRSDPVLRRLAAVRNGRAFINPAGAWNWDRYGIESALQLQWAGKTLHPELFSDVDMVARTKTFYKRFLHYQLGDADAKRILAGQDPM